MGRYRLEWVYWILIIVLCLLIIRQQTNPTVYTGIQSTNSNLLLNYWAPDSARSESGSFSMLVMISPDDCGSCLGVIRYLNKLHSEYPASFLRITGLFLGGADELRSFRQTTECRFPVYLLETLNQTGEVIIGSYDTPLILLYDKHSRLRNIQPPASSRAMHANFYKMIDSII